MVNHQYSSNLNPKLSRSPFQSMQIGTMRNSPKRKQNNWAVIDTQNVYMAGIKSGRPIRWGVLRHYLRIVHGVNKAFFFAGYLEENSGLYDYMERKGFIPQFRPVTRLKDGSIDGGNIDADLTGFAMDNKYSYNKIVIVADDADYLRTIQSLIRQNKLEMLISSHAINKTSYLLRREVPRNLLISIQGIEERMASTYS